MKFLKKIPLKTIFPIVILVILALLLTFVGYTIYFTLFLILGLFLYFLFFTKFFNTKTIKPIYIWIFLGAFLLLNTLTVVLIKTKENKTQTLTPEQCQAIYQEYDSTILDISAKDLKGTIGIKIDEADCRATVSYNFLFSANLNKNYKVSEYGTLEYEYAGVLRDPSKNREDSDYGVLFPAYKNKETLPDPYDFGLDAVDYGNWSDGDSTSTFYHGWQSSYIFRENSFEKIVAKSVYEVLDGSNAMNIEETGENSYSYSLNAELAAKQGSLVKDFDLTITKRN